MAESAAKMKQQQAEEETARKALVAKVRAHSYSGTIARRHQTHLRVRATRVDRVVHSLGLTCIAFVCAPAQSSARNRIVTPGRRDSTPSGTSRAGGLGEAAGGLQLPKSKRRPTPRGI